ncbi:TPA: helix-turn-helix transcriptional regulator [Serratia marcescens]|nr:helix-turn-helix transcriptional regulator [Serratia marcescens]
MGISSSNYSEKLKQIRKAEGLTQATFAKELELGLSTVRNYESGQKNAGLTIVDKVTNHPRFEKYTMWLMNGKTSEAAGQISPTLSPDGHDNTSDPQRGQKAG